MTTQTTHPPTLPQVLPSHIHQADILGLDVDDVNLQVRMVCHAYTSHNLRHENPNPLIP